MPPLEIFIGPIVGFVVFYAIGWSMRNTVHDMNGPRDYATFAGKAMGTLFAIGIFAHLTGCEMGTL